jgi:hypothetical protein
MSANKNKLADMAHLADMADTLKTGGFNQSDALRRASAPRSLVLRRIAIRLRRIARRRHERFGKFTTKARSHLVDHFLPSLPWCVFASFVPWRFVFLTAPGYCVSVCQRPQPAMLETPVRMIAETTPASSIHQRVR